MRDRERSLFKFCKAKITTYDDIFKQKKFYLELDNLKSSLPNIPYIPPENGEERNILAENNNGNIIARHKGTVLRWEHIAPEERESFFRFWYEEQRIYFPDRKVKINDRFYKFNDRPKPNPPFTKKLLEKKTLPELKNICKTFNISVNNKGKAEIVSAMMRFQRKGDIGKKEKCYDGMPVILLEALDGNGFSFNDYDFNSEENSNSHVSTN